MPDKPAVDHDKFDAAAGMLLELMRAGLYWQTDTHWTCGGCWPPARAPPSGA